MYSDEEPPIVETLLEEIQMNSTSDGSVLIHWPEDEMFISDNSGSYVITSSYNFPDYFGIGITPVVFTVTDPSENSVNGSFTVIVQGTFALYFV